MNKSIENQIIALAGVAQAVALVQQIATRGNCSQSAFATTLQSVLKIDSDNVVDVYGGINGLRTGFTQLKLILQGDTEPGIRQQARYSAMLMVLQSKLMKSQKLLDLLSSGLERAGEQARFFSPTHENVIASLAELYQNTVSTLSPKVMVHGNPGYLSNPDQANKIRALLLAGIRSVVLWEQCGGKRWKLLLNRKKMLRELDRMIPLLSES